MGNCGHSQQKICMRGDAVLDLDCVVSYTAVFSLVTVHADGALSPLALAGLDEEQFGFSSHGGACCSNERFHQQVDADSVAVHAVHTPLQAVAENATHHAVPVGLASARQLLHQRQHLLARAVPMNLHLKAEPAKDFVQAL